MAKIVEVTNPVTGQPTQVDQLDHTAQQIDDGLNIARGVSNPNLLDNWYFADCVDQRGGYVAVPGISYYDKWGGQATGVTDKYYTATHTPGGYDDQYQITVNGAVRYVPISSCVRGYIGAGYGPDRWFAVGNNSTVLINNEYIEFTSQVINGYLAQKLESKSYAGKTITLSAIVKVTQNCGLHAVCYDSKSTVISDSFTTLYPSSDFQLVQHTIDVPNSSAVLQCDFITLAEGKTSITVKAAKLELGTQQTLAHQDENGNWVLNEIPDYGEQLARCQRYQWITNADNNMPTPLMYAATINTLVGSVQFPVTMRTKPAVTGVFARNVLTGETLSAFNNDSINVVTNQDGVCYIAGMFSPLTVGGWYQVAAIFNANL